MTESKIHFDLGQVVATPGALDALAQNDSNGLEYLRRHASGDWGDVCAEDRQANEDALRTGARIFSAYLLPDNSRLWIITDATVDDGTRPSTALLLSQEY
jgi:hypothetical protein